MAIRLKPMLVITSALLLGSCGGLGGGPCAKVDFDIEAQPGLFANTIVGVLHNRSGAAHQVTIKATDPGGHSTTLGPISLAAGATVSRYLGPLPKSMGSTREQLEKNGAKFEILKCE